MISHRTPVFISTDRDGVFLREIMPDDASPLFAVIEQSREHLSHWVDTGIYPNADSVHEMILHPPDPLVLRLGVWDCGTASVEKKLVGGINLVPAYSADRAAVQYWTGAPFVRQGYASCALRGLISYVVRYRPYLQLDAATRIENEAGRRVLLSGGFREIGWLAHRYYHYDRPLDRREALDSIVRDLDAAGRATLCAPVGQGYPHHTIAELLHEGDRIVRFFPPRNGELITPAYRDVLACRLAEARWQLE